MLHLLAGRSRSNATSKGEYNVNNNNNNNNNFYLHSVNTPADSRLINDVVFSRFKSHCN